MNHEEATRPDEQPASREEELARKAAHFVKASKPRIRRFVAFTRPRAEKAGRDAARYVREHESEIKNAAFKLAQSRLPGSLGMVVGSLGGTSNQNRPAPVICSGCQTTNLPSAKFCSECGAALIVKTDSATD